jgi:hypothetical protein
MNISEAMKFKREIQTICSINVKLLDTEDGFVLYVERKILDSSAYKLLSDFTAKNSLNVQLYIRNFIISSHALASQ